MFKPLGKITKKHAAFAFAFLVLCVFLVYLDRRESRKEGLTAYPTRTFRNETMKSFLSVGTLSTNTAVGLWKTDDGSGRQQWDLKSLGGGVNNVIVHGGRKDPKYLSASPDGTRIFLAPKDDGSGLQRWSFKTLYGRTFEVSLAGGKGLTNPKANLLSINASGKLCLAPVASVLWGDAERSRQIWSINTPGVVTALSNPDVTLPPNGCPYWCHPRSESYVAPRVAMLKERAKQKFLVCQFGDSITGRLETQVDFKDFVQYYCDSIGIPREQFGNFGISGDTVQTMMHRLCNGGVPSGAKVVVFHIGTNNMRCSGDSNTPPEIARKAFACIDLVRKYNPTAKVVVASIFNRGDFQDKRAQTNAEIKKIIDARRDPNITFTTAGETLTMNNTFDRLHPNPAGWKQVFDNGFGAAVKNALLSSV